VKPIHHSLACHSAVHIIPQRLVESHQQAGTVVVLLLSQTITAVSALLKAPVSVHMTAVTSLLILRPMNVNATPQVSELITHPASTAVTQPEEERTQKNANVSLLTTTIKVSYLLNGAVIWIIGPLILNACVLLKTRMPLIHMIAAGARPGAKIHTASAILR